MAKFEGDYASSIQNDSWIANIGPKDGAPSRAARRSVAERFGTLLVNAMYSLLQTKHVQVQVKAVSVLTSAIMSTQGTDIVAPFFSDLAALLQTMIQQEAPALWPLEERPCSASAIFARLAHNWLPCH